MDYSQAIYASQLIYGKTGKKVNPDLLWAQLRHETGNFSSQLSQYHNYAGIKTDEDTGLLVPEEEYQRDGGPRYYKSYEDDNAFVADWVNNIAAFMADADVDEIKTPEEFVHWLTQGEQKYFTDDPASYAQSMYGLMGDISDVAAPRQNIWGTNSNVWQNPQLSTQKEYGTWEGFGIKFANAALDNGLVSLVRTTWANMNPFEWAKGNWPGSDYQPDDEDRKLLSDAFGADLKTRNWIIENAANKTALKELIEMQQRNKRLQKEADEIPVGFSTIGTILGSMTDPTALLIAAVNPVAGVAAKAASLSTKAASMLVKARMTTSAVSGFINKSKMMRYGMYALSGAGTIGADRYAAERWGNYEPDYAMNMTLGAVLGAAGYRLQQWQIGKNSIPDVAKAMDSMENNVAANVMGAIPPMDVVSNEKAFLKNINVASSSPLIRRDALYSRLVNNGSLYMVSMEDAIKLAKRHGIQLEKDAKAFTIPKRGVSVLIAEKVTKKNIDGLIAHEVGVHLALQDQLAPEAYDALMNSVIHQAQTSKDRKWRRAAKMGDSPEEILAYWVEQNPKASSPIIQDITKAMKEGRVNDAVINQTVKKAMKDFSEKDVLDILKKNAKENIVPFYKAADGSYDVAGIKYSKGNLFTGVFDEVVDAGEGALERQKDIPLYSSISKWMETGRLFGNIYGIMANSRSPLLQKAADRLFHDARMTKKNLTHMPAEEIKRFVLDQLNRKWNDFTDARQEYINETFGVVKGVWNRNNYINAVNEQIIKCHDAMVSEGDVSVYPEQIQKLAKQIMNLREDLIKFGKTDSEKLGGLKGKGALIEKDWEPLSNNFYRVTDEDKLLEQMSKFQNMDDFREMLEDYASRALDREKLTAYLEDQRKKEIELKQKEWDELHKDDGEPVREEVTEAEKAELERLRQEMNKEVKEFKAKEKEAFDKKHEKWEEKVTAPPPDEIVPNERALKTLMSDTEWEGYKKKHKRDYEKKKAKYDELRNRPKPKWEYPKRIPKEYKGHPEEYAKIKADQHDKQVALWEKRRRNPYPKYVEPKRPTVGKYDSPAKYKKAIEKKNREARKKWEEQQSLPEPVLKEKSTMHLKSVKTFNKYVKEHVVKKDHDFDVQQRAYERTQASRPEYKAPDSMTSEERAAYDAEMAEKVYKYIQDWAYGMTDRGNSRLEWGQSHNSNAIDHFKFRLPMDTSFEMQLENGTTFCFDRDLRDFQMDEYIPQIMNRMAGEMALQATIGNKKVQQIYFDKIAQELGKSDLILNHERERQALEYGLDRLLGRRSYNLRESTTQEQFSNMLRSWSYASKGAMMTLAQLGEFGGAIAYGGMKVLLNTIPKLGETIKAARMGKDAAETIDNVRTALYADDVQTRAWKITSSTNSRIFRHQMDRKQDDFAGTTRTAELLDKTNSFIKRAALVTSAINCMPRLTNAMVQAMRSSAIEDCYKWAAGKDFGNLRNPFSPAKLNAVGISDVNHFRTQVKKYLVDGKGDIDKWWDEDPTTFFQWKQLMDNQAYRGIQQSSIGNSNLFKEQHRIVFQFKDFALRAVNGQLMRALNSHELDDALAMGLSMATNAASYYALTTAKGYMMYPNDEKKRQKYFDDRLSWRMLALAGFTRASFMTPLSFAMDGVEAITGQSYFRTTVDNSTRRGRGGIWEANSGWEMGAKAGQQMWQQMPALTSMSDTTMAAVSAGRMATGYGDQQDIDNFIRGIPLGTWLPLVGLASYAKGASGLPKDDKKPENKQTAWGHMIAQRRQPVKRAGKLSKLLNKEGD